MPLNLSDSTSQRWFFALAAAFNFAVAAALGLFTEPTYRLLAMPPPTDRLAFDMFVGVVALFGLSYAWIARSPSDSRQLIGLGAIGKTAAFLTLLIHWLSIGDVSARMVLLGSADLAFAAAFLYILRQSPSNSGTS